MGTNVVGTRLATPDGAPLLIDERDQDQRPDTPQPPPADDMWRGSDDPTGPTARDFYPQATPRPKERAKPEPMPRQDEEDPDDSPTYRRHNISYCPGCGHDLRAYHAEYRDPTEGTRRNRREGSEPNPPTPEPEPPPAAEKGARDWGSRPSDDEHGGIMGMDPDEFTRMRQEDRQFGSRRL